MNRLTSLGLTTALAFGLSLPALAQTAPATTPAPADSGIKTTAPDTKPAPVPAKHRHSHVKHGAKAAPAAAK
jgi:hypothetical protein